MNKKLKRRLEIIYVIVLLLLIFGGLIFLIKNNSGAVLQSTDTKTQLSSSTSSLVQFVPVTNNIKVTTPSGTYLLSGNWKIILIQEGNDNTNYSCKDINNLNCIIYTISNGNNVFYLTSPGQYITNTSGNTTQVSMTIKVLNKLSNFIFEKYKLYKQNSSNIPIDANLTVYKQVYGQVDNSLFASSGLLSINEKTNADQINSFKEMLNNVTKQ